MARRQFTFTFTNAQPGSVVSFDGHVTDRLYAAATGTARLGHPLILDSSNSLSVWSDAAELTATTEDGAGNGISATATIATPSVTVADGTPGQNPFGGGSAASSPFVELTVPTAESDWHIEYGDQGDTWAFPGGGVIQNTNDGSNGIGGFLTSLVDFWGSGGVFECTVLIPSAGQDAAITPTISVQLFTDEPQGTASGAGGTVNASNTFADGAAPFNSVGVNADAVGANVVKDTGIALDVPFKFRVEAVGPVVVVKIDGVPYAQTSGAQSTSVSAADQSRIQLVAGGLVTFSDFHMWVPNTPTAS